MRSAWAAFHDLLSDNRTYRRYVAAWLTSPSPRDLKADTLAWDDGSFITAKALLFTLGKQRVDKLELGESCECAELPNLFPTTVDYFASFAPVMGLELFTQLTGSLKGRKGPTGSVTLTQEMTLRLTTPWNSHIFLAELYPIASENYRPGDVIEFTHAAGSCLLPILNVRSGIAETIALLPECSGIGPKLLSLVGQADRSRASEYLLTETAVTQKFSDLLTASAAVVGGSGVLAWNLANPWREIQSLMSVRDSPLRDLLLNPDAERYHKLEERSFALPHLFNSRYNASQRGAIEAIMKQDVPVTLVQGPPGTGKTTLVQGILGLVLYNSYWASEKAEASPTKPINYENRRRNLKEERNWKALTRTYTVPISSLDDPELVETHFTDPPDYQNCIVLPIESPRKKKTPRVLVCAPSNAAVDEIVLRLTERISGGALTSDGERRFPAVVRVGPNASPAVAPYTLAAKAQDISAKYPTEKEAAQAILRDTSVILATLMLSSLSLFDEIQLEFDLIIIDEATQATEPLTLIPLRHATRVVMIGDPAQLPATVFSQAATRKGLTRSLFSRMVKGGKWPLHVLSEQYRMHPLISAFPREEFYTVTAQGMNDAGQTLELRESILRDAPEVSLRYGEHKPMAWEMLPYFRPFVFYSVHTGTETSLGHSKSNRVEANTVVGLLSLWLVMCRERADIAEDFAKRIAVITPYSEQVTVIRDLLERSELGQNAVEVNTVDAFQGREKDVIIFSAVRSLYTTSTNETPRRRNTNVGFLADARRLNVALTRARNHLWVVGNADYLEGNPLWSRLIRHSRDTGVLLNLPATEDSSFIWHNVWGYLSGQPEIADRFRNEMKLTFESLRSVVR